MNKGPSTTFCALPWFHLMSNNQSKLFPCCIADAFSETYLPADSTNVHEVRNLGQFQKLRNEMLAGMRPKICRSCFEIEDRGLQSARIDANNKFSQEIISLFNKPNDDLSIAGDILSVDFRIDNICNLKCRMCGPENSRLLIDEWKNLNLLWENNVPIVSWSSDEEWRKFFKNNSKLEYVSLAGGEPFTTPRVLWIIDHLIAEDLAKKINISFHTNLTKFSPELIAKLANFRTTKIMVSIEGPPIINSYIRHQSNWDILNSNFHKLNEFSKYPFVNANFEITVQAYNILYLSDIVEYSSTWKNLSPPNLNILREPVEFQFSVFPRNIRLLAAERIKKLLMKLDHLFIHSNSNEVTRLHNQLNDLVIRLEDINQINELSKFISRTKAMDKFRNQNISDIIPEIKELFSSSLTPT